MIWAIAAALVVLLAIVIWQRERIARKWAATRARRITQGVHLPLRVHFGQGEPNRWGLMWPDGPDVRVESTPSLWRRSYALLFKPTADPPVRYASNISGGGSLWRYEAFLAQTPDGEERWSLGVSEHDTAALSAVRGQVGGEIWRPAFWRWVPRTAWWTSAALAILLLFPIGAWLFGGAGVAKVAGEVDGQCRVVWQITKPGLATPDTGVTTIAENLPARCPTTKIDAQYNGHRIPVVGIIPDTWLVNSMVGLALSAVLAVGAGVGIALIARKPVTPRRLVADVDADTGAIPIVAAPATAAADVPGAASNAVMNLEIAAPKADSDPNASATEATEPTTPTPSDTTADTPRTPAPTTTPVTLPSFSAQVIEAAMAASRRRSWSDEGRPETEARPLVRDIWDALRRANWGTPILVAAAAIIAGRFLPDAAWRYLKLAAILAIVYAVLRTVWMWWRWHRAARQTPQRLEVVGFPDIAGGFWAFLLADAKVSWVVKLDTQPPRRETVDVYGKLATGSVIHLGRGDDRWIAATGLVPATRSLLTEFHELINEA